MARIKTIGDDTKVSLKDRLLGSDADASGRTRNYLVKDLFSLFNDSAGYIDVEHYDIDDAGSLYDYHGGKYSSGAWVIVRYLKSDITQIRQATVSNNPTYTVLSSAWTDRSTLNY